MTKLIIFDCDGVLVDSEIIANRIDAAMLTTLGYPISTEESIKRFTGMNAKTVRALVMQESGISLPENLSELTGQLILQALEEELLPLMLPVLEAPLFNTLTKCVASSSPRERVLKSLQITGQDHFFKDEHIFTSAQVKNGKPAPDLFLLAAEQMGYHPKDCLVIEDSIAGITAARAANMQVVGFLGGQHAKFEWYKARIQSQMVTVALHPLELLIAIAAFMMDEYV